MSLLQKLWTRKPKPPIASRLYSPDEVPDSLESTERNLARLRRYDEILAVKPMLDELVEEELETAEKNITDPGISQETGQFYRGAFWLAKRLEKRLSHLSRDIEQKERVLTDARKKESGIPT